MPTPDPVAPSIAQLLALFESGALRGVRFPDVDGDALGELTAAVRAGAAAVADAEEALAAARASLADKQQALAVKGQRALAYARIYAEGSPELRTELDRIGAPAPRASAEGPLAPPRKRGRPPKVRPDASLFQPSAATSTVEEAPSSAVAAE